MPTVYTRHVDPEEKAPPKKKVIPPIKPIKEDKPEPPVKETPIKKAPLKKEVKEENAKRK